MTTEFAYIAVRDNGKWQILGAYTAKNIGVAYDEAVSIYGTDNVQATYDTKEIDKLNRQRMIGQVKEVGHKISTGLGSIAKRFEAIETQARASRAHTPSAQVFDKPMMEPPAPVRGEGMMPPPGYQRQQPPERQPSSTMTKGGRSKRAINIFKDCRYTSSYLSQQQRLTREYRRRRYRD